MSETRGHPSPRLDLDGDPVDMSCVEDNPTSPGNGNSADLLQNSVSQPHTLSDLALVFLSNASAGTLVSLGLGLLVATYLLLGRLGLLLVGFVGGVVLHVSWEGSQGDDGKDGLTSNVLQRRKELGVEVANRLMNWQGVRAMKRSAEPDHPTSSSDHGLAYPNFRPATSAALTVLTDAIIQNYVRWWYEPILPSEMSFPHSCRTVLVKAICCISSHLSRKRPAETFVQFLTNSCSIAIVFLNELSIALASAPSTSTSLANTINSYLDKDPESNLATVLSVKQQRKKLEIVADDILQTFLDTKTYDCEPVKVFLREIFAGVILETTIKNCSRAEWINGWIVYLLEGERELMNAIDAGVEGVQKSQWEETKANSGPVNETFRGKHIYGDQRDGDVVRKQHKRQLTKAEEAMEEATREAKRLSDMIAADEARKCSEYLLAATDENEDAVSAATPEGIATPTSSNDDKNRDSGEVNRYASVDILRNMGESEYLQGARDGSNIPVRQESGFTSFDQHPLVNQPSSLEIQADSLAPMAAMPLRLHDASVSIFDDSVPGVTGNIRGKPATEYLLQIEPASSHRRGWVIARKYADFEDLHEVLRRISVVSGVSEFTERHRELPTWKGQTTKCLRLNLEEYLQHALRYEPLAESEAMKRFLEKTLELGPTSTTGLGKTAFTFPSQAAFETMGKGVLEALANAPKGVAGGGKAVFEGVAGVFGSVGGAGKRSIESPVRSKESPNPKRFSSEIAEGFPGEAAGNGAEENLSAIMAGPNKSPLPRRTTEPQALATDFPGSLTSTPLQDERSVSHPSSRPYINGGSSGLGRQESQLIYTSTEETGETNNGDKPLGDTPSSNFRHITNQLRQLPGSANDETTVGHKSAASSHPSLASPQIAPRSDEKPYQNVPLSEEETRVVVQLLFAVINEMYSLSSVWNIRKSLLNAAKTFLLRPGNPNVESIRVLVQESIIDSNISDEALATHIIRLRENSLPTEEELKLWPPPLNDKEKEKLRVKARKLLIERGMPQALVSIMGAFATGESLGRIFDFLQIEQVARGFIFALLLQALRAATQ